MKVTESMRKGFLIKVNGEEIRLHKIDYDVNGNPRYVVHFPSLGINKEDFGKVPGFTKYRAKWFGGGYVFQSHNVQSDLEFYLDLVKRFYERKAKGWTV